MSQISTNFFIQCTDLITPDHLTCDLLCINKSKILFIESDKDFDAFTHKYGYVDITDALKIRWDYVTEDFSGIGVSPNTNRFYYVTFLGKDYVSWLSEIGLNKFVTFSKIEATVAPIETKSETKGAPAKKSRFTRLGNSIGKFTGLGSKKTTNKAFANVATVTKRYESETESKSMSKSGSGSESKNESRDEIKDESVSKSEGETKKEAEIETNKESESESGSESASESESNSDNQSKKRYFKVIDPVTGTASGRYTGDTPKQAASKGYTKMLQELKREGKKEPKQSTIYLRESTRGSARKVYGYEAKREKLAEPQELCIIDRITGQEKTITYEYRNKIHKVPVPENLASSSII